MRCVLCHDDLGPTPLRCPGCGTLAHAECAGEAPRCPTLGCRARRPPAGPPAEVPGWAYSATVVTGVLTLSCVVAAFMDALLGRGGTLGALAPLALAAHLLGLPAIVGAASAGRGRPASGLAAASILATLLLAVALGGAAGVLSLLGVPGRLLAGLGGLAAFLALPVLAVRVAGAFVAGASPAVPVVGAWVPLGPRVTRRIVVSVR